MSEFYGDPADRSSGFPYRGANALSNREHNSDQEEPDYRPLLDIWFSTRSTLRYILSMDTDYGVALLAGMSGWFLTLNPVLHIKLGLKFTFAQQIIGPILGGIGIGFIFVFASAFLLHRIGRRLGGQGDNFELRLMMAWSCVPLVTAMISGLPVLLFLDDNFFEFRVFPSSMLVMLGIHSTLVVLMIAWHLILLVRGVSEIHEFGLVRTCLLVALVETVVLGPVGALLYWLNGAAPAAG